MKTARIILTAECERECSYCCNTPKNPAMHQCEFLGDLEDLNAYDEFVLTGGEPLGSRDMTCHTVAVATRLNRRYFGRPVYLYTSVWAGAMQTMENNLHRFAGITYTLHYPMTHLDIDNLYLFQLSMHRRDPSQQLNNRLIINASLPVPQWPAIQPGLWREIRKVDFQPEGMCPINEDEDLFYSPPRVGGDEWPAQQRRKMTRTSPSGD